MMTSWAVVGFGVWKCQFFERQHVIIQAQKEGKVAELIKGAGNPGYAATSAAGRIPTGHKFLPSIDPHFAPSPGALARFVPAVMSAPG